jgi:lipoate-protein ligase A
MMAVKAQKGKRLWRLVVHPALNGFLNMAMDELLYGQARRGEAIPTLRFYGWEGRWVSFGYFQRPGRALNLEAAEQRGVHSVRRLTGGKAVVHAEDLTYSVTMGDAPSWGMGIALKESYRQISRALASGFRRLGLPVDAPAAVPPAGRGNSFEGVVPCFAVTSDYEITVGGKKLAGSAQHRERNVFLQHGSIPLTRYNRELAEEVLAGSKRAGVELLRARYATLEEAAGRPIRREEAIEALKSGFGETFGVEFFEEDLKDLEPAARELAERKYSNPAWNENRPPRPVGEPQAVFTA